MILVIIKLILIGLILMHSAAMFFDFFCEMRASKLYRKKQDAIKEVETLGKSMAVIKAKIFKIEMDYLAVVEIIEKKRRFVRNMVLNRKNTFFYK